MESKQIVITPVSQSGVGSWMVVSIDGVTYKSTATQDEFNYDAMDKAMDEIYTEIAQEDREAVELKFYSLKDAMKVAEEEEAYRAAHPEEFMMHPEDMNTITEDSTDTITESDTITE